MTEKMQQQDYADSPNNDQQEQDLTAGTQATLHERDSQPHLLPLSVAPDWLHCMCFQFGEAGWFQSTNQMLWHTKLVLQLDLVMSTRLPRSWFELGREWTAVVGTLLCTQ